MAKTRSVSGLQRNSVPPNSETRNVSSATKSTPRELRGSRALRSLAITKVVSRLSYDSLRRGAPPCAQKLRSARSALHFAEYPAPSAHHQVQRAVQSVTPAVGQGSIAHSADSDTSRDRHRTSRPHTRDRTSVRSDDSADHGFRCVSVAPPCCSPVRIHPPTGRSHHRSAIESAVRRSQRFVRPESLPLRRRSGYSPPSRQRARYSVGKSTSTRSRTSRAAPT